MNKPPIKDSFLRWSRSLRAQITLGVGALLLLAIFVHFAVIHPALQRRVVALEREKIQIYSDSVAFQISGDFEAAIYEIKAIAAVPVMRDLNLAAVGPMFTRLESISPYYIDFTLLDTSGRVILRPSKPERVGEDRSMREYFRVARDERRTYLSEVFISTAGNRALNVSTPVYDHTGTNLIAVLTGSMALMDRNPEMYHAILQPSVPKEWRVSLWSRDRHLLAHSSNSNSNLLRYVGGAETDRDNQGNLWHVATARIINTDWAVQVEIPDAFVHTQVTQVTRPVAWTAIGSFLGLLTLGLIAVRRLVHPLETLTTALNRFGRDGRPEITEPAGSGEIADAIEAFNRMAREREQAESARRESLERYHLVARATNDAVWDWNLKTDEIWWNENLHALFGYDPSEIERGIKFWETRLHPEDKERALAKFHAVIDSGGETWFDEYRFRRKDGSYAEVLDRGYVLRGDGGRAIRVIGAIQDLTERNRVEARYRTLFDYAPNGILVADPDGYYLDANDRMCEMLGYTRAEVVRLHISDIVSQAEINRIAPGLKAIMAERQYHEEWQFQRRDKSTFPGEVIAAKMPDGNVLAMVRDITDRKRSEEALAWRTRVAVLRADIAEALSRGGTLHDISHQISQALVTHLNAAFARVWILNESNETLELVASAGLYTHLNGPHSRIKLGDIKIGRIAQNRTPHVTNDVLHDPQISDPAWAEHESMTSFAGYPLLVENHVVGVIALFSRTPISQEMSRELSHVAHGLAQWILRKQTEEDLHTAQSQLRDYARELEARVTHRTADLKAMNEQLEAFVYSIAHDLRAPLRAVIGYSQMLVEDYGAVLDEEARELLKRIQSSSEFMDRLVIDLLSYGRASSAELELAPVDVRKQWECALSQCSAQIHETRAQVETVEPLPTVRGHEATLCQALANLLSNALKFVEPGKQPQVRFWAEDHGDSVRLWISDNGIGIPSRHKERIFRVFERLQAARYPGTGIGLSIVRKGIERMGGKVGVESELGKGSKFWIELPKAP